jgi:hypothetical protein
LVWIGSPLIGLFVQEVPHHDKVPNLKLVMNPEGKLHDWTDLPEEEIPELQQIAAGGPSAEIAHSVVENLQTCKGRGKIEHWTRQQPQQQQPPPQKGSTFFASSFRQVFDSRRGLFENVVSARYQPVNPRCDTHTTLTNTSFDRTPASCSDGQVPLSRSLTSPGNLTAALPSKGPGPSLPPAPSSWPLRQPPAAPSSPRVPRRMSSKAVLAHYKSTWPSSGHREECRPAIRSFFGCS